MNRLKSNFTCLFCQKIYKEPIEFPCEHLICREHLLERDVVKMNKIPCVDCKKEFEVKNREFRLNKPLNKLLENQVYLNDEEMYLKQKIEDSIRVLYQIYDEFISSKNKLEIECHNYFQDLRRKIDIHRETFKEKIDDIYMDMIERTIKCEASYLKNLNEKLEKDFETESVDTEFKKLQNSFRNPNIKTETIREIQLKQEETISDLKSKLNEMSQIKDYLKALNGFKPNIDFDKDLFGVLYLNEYSNACKFKSLILTEVQQSNLIKLCEFDLKDKFTLLYRGSLHGFKPEDFHSKCDNHANTLILVKAKETGFIFGGFTMVPWHTLNSYSADPNAFLFSLTNKYNKPSKINIDHNQKKYAIFGGADRGPSFGCSDCNIFTKCETSVEKNCRSELGASYEHPQYAYGTNEAKSFMAGSNYFQLDEIEVFKKE